MIYLYNFQEYDYTKLGEIIFKNLKHMVKRSKDFNISAMEHNGYAKRLNKYIKECIYTKDS